MSAGATRRRVTLRAQRLPSLVDELDVHDQLAGRTLIRSGHADRAHYDVARQEVKDVAVSSAKSSVITWEDPPEPQGGRRSTPPAWINELRSNPGRWGLISQSAKSAAHGRGWKKRFPELEIVSRRRLDGGGFLVYGRWTS